MGIQIREMTESDIPMILDLLYELGRPKPQKDYDADTFRQIIMKYLNDNDKTILVAELDYTKIVGMASLIFLPRLNQKSVEMYIPEIIVSEKFQNQGIGKKIMCSCVSIAKEKKCHRIRLESGNQRKASHRFYRNLRFEQSSLSFTKILTQS